MKKFLLFAIVALSAMTANAKEPLKPLFSATTHAPKTQQMQMASMSSMFAPTKSMRKAAAKVEANMIDMIEVDADWLDNDEEGETIFYPSAPFTIQKTGEMGEYKGVAMEKVKISGMCLGYATVDAFMSDTQIAIPYQVCYNYKTYGDMYLGALVLNEETQRLEYDQYDLTFTYDSGWWNCDQYGWIITMSGEYEGEIWTYGQYPQLVGANAKDSGWMVNSQVTSWTEFEDAAYIEQSEEGDEIHIFGFYGLAHLVMYPDPENPGAVLIPTWQTIDKTVSQQEQETYGYDYHLLGHTVTAEGKLKIDEDMPYIPAHFVSAFEIAYDDDQYTGMFTLFDESGAGYYMGRQTAMSFSFTPESGQYFLASPYDPAGIDDITVAKNSDNKKYNLAGQNVAKNYKGIVISNGKKIVRK